MLKRRDLILAGAAMPWMVVHAAPLSSKPIRIVVPNAAGGAADITARTVAQKLSESLGQPVIVDNRPSAGGVVAGDMVARAEPDGHTLLLVSSGTAVSAALFKSLPFDTVKDFAPISRLASFDLCIATAENGKFRTLAQLVAHARANPGRLNIGTPNVGTTQHLAAELFKSSAGIEVEIVPFNGTPPVVTALRGGDIDAMVDILGPLMPQITTHALHPLAVLGERRAVQLPDVPTVREAAGGNAGLSSFNVSSWNGLSAPAKTPREVIAKLASALAAVLAQPEVKKRLLDLNLSAESSTPEQLGEQLEGEIRRWSAVIAKAGISRQ